MIEIARKIYISIDESCPAKTLRILQS